MKEIEILKMMNDEIVEFLKANSEYKSKLEQQKTEMKDIFGSGQNQMIFMIRPDWNASLAGDYDEKDEMLKMKYFKAYLKLITSFSQFISNFPEVQQFPLLDYRVPTKIDNLKDYNHYSFSHYESVTFVDLQILLFEKKNISTSYKWLLSSDFLFEIENSIVENNKGIGFHKLNIAIDYLKKFKIIDKDINETILGYFLFSCLKEIKQNDPNFSPSKLFRKNTNDYMGLSFEVFEILKSFNSKEQIERILQNENWPCDTKRITSYLNNLIGLLTNLDEIIHSKKISKVFTWLNEEYKKLNKEYGIDAKLINKIRSHLN